MKNVKDTGRNTITHTKRQLTSFTGYRPFKPMVYCGLYPVINEEYTDLRDALETPVK